MTKDEKIELLKKLDEKERLIQDKTLENFIGSPIQNQYICSTAKIAILGGANQSGKSTVGGVDTLICATGIIPTSLKDLYPKDKIQMGGYWVSSLGFKETLEITRPKIFQYLPKSFITGFSDQKGILNLKYNSEITFKSGEAGRDKYQGAVKRGVWLDEEHSQDIWDECYMRTIALKGWMRKTFTPLKGLTWAYQHLYLKAGKYYETKNNYKITEDVGVVHTLEELKKLKERTLEVKENTSSEADPDIEFYQMTIYDNIHLADIEIQRAERKYKDDPIQYSARILGRFSKITGRNVFNADKLIKLQDNCQSKFRRGEIVEGQFKESKQGKLIIFKEKKPSGQGHYVVGADVAEGLEHGDYSCAQILEKGTCEQVAMWHGHVSPDEFGRILVDIGVYYNYAILGPERNFHGFGVVSRIRSHFNYRRLYYDRDVPNTVLTKQKTGQKRFGWDTNKRTRPMMITELSAFINSGQLRINDFQTVEELFTFIYDRNGDTGAMGGCYDDRVMALAIAIQMYKRTGLPHNREQSLDYPISVSPTTGY